MRNLFFVLFFILCFINPHAQVAWAQEKSEWISLFDGKTMKGWHSYGGGPVGSAWKIANQAMYLDTTRKSKGQIIGGGDIVTDQVFENFHLKLQWKIAKGGNSGIIFYVHEDDSRFQYPWQTGPEMQVLDTKRHIDGKIEKHRGGDLYDLISSSTRAEKPAGEWNDVEIKCMNGKLDMYLNNVHVVSTTLWNENWKMLIANSKFKSMPGFGTFKKGRLALQDHGDEVWFRNIRIKNL